MKEERDVPPVLLPESEDSLYQRLLAMTEENADLKARLRAKDRALREAVGDPDHSEIVSRSEMLVVLGDYLSKVDCQASYVSKPEFSQLLGVLYDEVPNVATRMRALHAQARAKKRSDSL
ncbi:MAG: hypothetical protein GY849_23370 [Deltaproteobacteria bacterium]|nr:hypothetical protein [Deltaproteobacteria bacterium]